MSLAERNATERYILNYVADLTPELLNARMHNAGYHTYTLAHARRALLNHRRLTLVGTKKEERKAEPSKRELIERLLKTTRQSYAAIARTTKSTYGSVASTAHMLKKKDPKAMLHRKGLRHASQISSSSNQRNKHRRSRRVR